MYGRYYKHSEAFCFDGSICGCCLNESVVGSEISDEEETTTRFEDEVDETNTQFVPPDARFRGRVVSL